MNRKIILSFIIVKKILGFIHNSCLKSGLAKLFAPRVGKGLVLPWSAQRVVNTLTVLEQPMVRRVVALNHFIVKTLREAPTFSTGLLIGSASLITQLATKGSADIDVRGAIVSSTTAFLSSAFDAFMAKNSGAFARSRKSGVAHRKDTRVLLVKSPTVDKVNPHVPSYYYMDGAYKFKPLYWGANNNPKMDRWIRSNDKEVSHTFGLIPKHLRPSYKIQSHYRSQCFDGMPVAQVDLAKVLTLIGSLSAAPQAAPVVVDAREAQNRIAQDPEAQRRLAEIAAEVQRRKDEVQRQKELLASRTTPIVPDDKAATRGISGGDTPAQPHRAVPREHPELQAASPSAVSPQPAQAAVAMSKAQKKRARKKGKN